jgi:hypothetical protein
MILSATSLVGWLISLQALNRTGGMPAFESDYLVLIGVYLPALVMVMRRANEGRVPAFVERIVARGPVWLRGRAVSSVSDGSATLG